ncbi:MAG: CDP-alcohol phosphatidyltransferase family protein [Oscillatoriaceae cyanobacterium]
MPDAWTEDISPNNEPATETDATPIRPRSFIEKKIKIVTLQLARFLSRWSWITPNRITVVSASLGGPVAAWQIYQGNYLVAVAAIAISGILDDIDGDLARTTGMVSPEGAILDSVLDRYVDFFVISALILISPEQHLIPGLLALLGASLVPYIRARTEAEGKKSVATIGDRTTRLILLVIGLLTQQLFALLIILAAISHLAALHRFTFALIPDSQD